MKHHDTATISNSIATDPELSTQAQILSVRIEAELGKPAVVMVTSAREGDGKSLTAYALATALENCSHRVSLVEVSHEEGTSHGRLSAFVDNARANYDFTVIDVAASLKTSTAMSLARLVDGVLLAVRIGRVATADDESIVSMLEQFGANIIGVVGTDADTIAAFERARRERPSLTRSQPRRNGEQNPAQAMIAIAERALR